MWAEVCKSFMWKRKTSRTKKHLLGYPELTHAHGDSTFPSLVLTFLPVRKFVSHWMMPVWFLQEWDFLKCPALLVIDTITGIFTQFYLIKTKYCIWLLLTLMQYYGRQQIKWKCYDKNLYGNHTKQCWLHPHNSSSVVGDNRRSYNAAQTTTFLLAWNKVLWIFLTK